MDFMDRITNLLALPKASPKLDIRYLGKDRVIEKMWYIALEDIEKNYCIDTEYGVVYAAGGYNAHSDWGGIAFNRDTAYSGLLVLNCLYPKEMLTSIKVIRKYRGKLKFKCTPETKLEGIGGVEVLDLDFTEFKKIFHEGSAIAHTDDVAWIASHEHVKADGATYKYNLNFDSQTILLIRYNGTLNVTFNSVASGGNAYVKKYTRYNDAVNPKFVELQLPLPVLLLEGKFTVTGVKDGTPFTITDISAFSYIYGILDKSSNTDLKNMLCALHDYYLAAYQFEYDIDPLLDAEWF